MQKRMTIAIPSTETPFLDFAWRRQLGLKLMMAPIPVFPLLVITSLFCWALSTHHLKHCLYPWALWYKGTKTEGTSHSLFTAKGSEKHGAEAICPASHIGFKAKTNPASRLLGSPTLSSLTHSPQGCTWYCRATLNTLQPKATAPAGHHQPGFGRRWVKPLPLSHAGFPHLPTGEPSVPDSEGLGLGPLKWKTRICRFSVLSDSLWFWRPHCLIHTINRLLSYFINIALFRTRQISSPVPNVSRNNKYQQQRYETL